jgi:hypothetical protein
MGERGVGVGGGRERSEIPFDTAEKLRCDFNHLTAASSYPSVVHSLSPCYKA